MPKFEGVYRAGNGSWYFKASPGRDAVTGKRIQVTKRDFATAGGAARARPAEGPGADAGGDPGVAARAARARRHEEGQAAVGELGPPDPGVAGRRDEAGRRAWPAAVEPADLGAPAAAEAVGGPEALDTGGCSRFPAKPGA